jgi:hypothetical protein
VKIAQELLRHANSRITRVCFSAQKRGQRKGLGDDVAAKKKGADAQHPWIWLKQILTP